MARRLHIADLQTWADVQMAAAFRERIFFISAPTTAPLQQNHQDPSYLLFFFFFDPPVVRNRLSYIFT